MARITKASAFAREMTDVEASWLAAVIDGEGHIRVDHPLPKYPHYAYPKIVVVNTCLPFLERVQEITQVGHIDGPRKKAKSHHADRWDWITGGHAALSVLDQILELLIVKQDQAITALATQLTNPVKELSSVN
jgi:hypothetical protein